MTAQERLDAAAIALMPVAISMSVRPAASVLGGSPTAQVDGARAAEIAYQMAEALMAARERHLIQPPAIAG